jgi:uncharacterized membrane protein YdfJ with MMPL/SSD domain
VNLGAPPPFTGAAESTTTAESTKTAESETTTESTTVESLTSSEVDDPPQDARATIDNIATIFFIIVFLIVYNFYIKLNHKYMTEEENSQFITKNNLLKS